MTHIDSGASAGRRTGLSGYILAVLLTVAACVSTTPMGDDISYAPPERAVAGPLVLKVPGDKGRVLQLIAADLQRAGFEIESQDPSSGELRARSKRQDLADCGVLTQTARGTEARIEGTAPLAAIFDSGVEGGVLRREVRVLTELTVKIGAEDPQKVTLDEKQTVTLRRLSADGDTLLSSQTVEAIKGAAMKFSDGTICTSSGKLAEAFR
jgi:hypothetical protein